MDRSTFERRLATVEGYFNNDEAWALFMAVRSVPVSRPLRVVEIGSYKGRSTVAIASALQERGGGTVVAVDPHAPTGKASYEREHGDKDTFSEFIENIEGAGVGEYVTIVREMSLPARAAYDGVAIDLLFIDGSHDYEDVLADIEAWCPLLSDAAVVAFNDPYAPGVNRAMRAWLRTTALVVEQPVHVNNTLFVKTKVHGTSRPATLRALGAYLFVERMPVKFVKLAFKGLMEATRCVYVPTGVAANERFAPFAR